MLGTITKGLLLLPVLKEMLNKIKSFSTFEKFKTQILKHTEMDLGFVRFCLQRRHVAQ